MFDFHLMLQVKLPVVDRIQRQSTKSSNGVQNKDTGDSSPEDIHIFFLNKVKSILVWFIVNFQVEAKTTSKHSSLNPRVPLGGEEGHENKRSMLTNPNHVLQV